LDRHRVESEQAQRAASAAAGEARAMETKRVEAERRLATARASVDSLRATGAGRNREGGRTP